VTIYLASSLVSSQYVYWQREDQQLRAYFSATNRRMNDCFDEEWAAAEERANDTFDPEKHGDDLQAVLFEDAAGIWPADYIWQLSSAVVKDACTLYELFLEQMANAVLHRHGARLTKVASEESWRWEDCELFYRHYIDIEVLPRNIETIVWIRNKLAHLRDELRTEKGLKEFKASLAGLGIDGPPTAEELDLGLAEHLRFASRGVFLTQLQTKRILDLLHEQIQLVALAAFEFDYRGRTNDYINALSQKAPIEIPKFSTKRLISFVKPPATIHASGIQNGSHGEGSP
jgi:hypothetical protein